jgi:hypothetical protein
LRWTGVDGSPQAIAPVAEALAATPFSFGLRDMRQDPAAVGYYEDDRDAVARTPDDVGQFCSQRFGDMLVRAGAHLQPTPTAMALEAELLDFRVVEGQTFAGEARIRTTLLANGTIVWAGTFTGTSKRWGRTHNPENLNEALSNSLASAAQQLLQDVGFAAALHGQGADAPPSQAPSQAPANE